MSESTLTNSRLLPSIHEELNLTTLRELIPDEESATKWFESIIWSDGRLCPRCDGIDTYETRNSNGMPYRCRDCNRYFSVKTSTLLASTKIPLHKWVWAIFLECTSVHGISSVKLHRDLGISQDSAWHMLHRIREGMPPKIIHVLQGFFIEEESVQDELQDSQHDASHFPSTTQAVDDSGVVDESDHATYHVTAKVDSNAIQPTSPQFVNHSQRTKLVSSGVEHTRVDKFHDKGQKQRTTSHTSDQLSHSTHDCRSSRECLERAQRDTYRHISKKHMNRYVSQFAYKYAHGDLNIVNRMTAIVQGMVGKQLKVKDLIAS